uniref:PDZ domain containing 11 n=2 Tax=Neognathae TaxID=8825 RepID=A0A8C4V8K8_FALTI
MVQKVAEGLVRPAARPSAAALTPLLHPRDNVSSGKGPGPKQVTVFHCWFLSQLGFNIRGGKASQLGIFISKVCLSFCRSLPAFCLFPWVLLSQLGVQGDCHMLYMHLQTHSCNFLHTKQQSDSPAPFPHLSPPTVLLVCCSPYSPSSPVPCECTGWTQWGGSGAGLPWLHGGELWHWPCQGSLLLSLLFLSQVIPDSDAHRAGLQEGDQVLSVNDVDFQDIEHSKVSTPVAQVLEQGQGRESIHTPSLSDLSTCTNSVAMHSFFLFSSTVWSLSDSFCFQAVEILKTAREITMRVRYFPYNYQRQKERTVH